MQGDAALSYVCPSCAVCKLCHISAAKAPHPLQGWSADWSLCGACNALMTKDVTRCSACAQHVAEPECSGDLDLDASHDTSALGGGGNGGSGDGVPDALDGGERVPPTEVRNADLLSSEVRNADLLNSEVRKAEVPSAEIGAGTALRCTECLHLVHPRCDQSGCVSEEDRNLLAASGVYVCPPCAQFSQRFAPRGLISEEDLGSIGAVGLVLTNCPPATLDALGLRQQMLGGENSYKELLAIQQLAMEVEPAPLVEETKRSRSSGGKKSRGGRADRKSGSKRKSTGGRSGSKSKAKASEEKAEEQDGDDDSGDDADVAKEGDDVEQEQEQEQDELREKQGTGAGGEAPAAAGGEGGRGEAAKSAASTDGKAGLVPNLSVAEGQNEADACLGERPTCAICNMTGLGSYDRLVRIEGSQWVHAVCAVLSSGVSKDNFGLYRGVPEAIARARRDKCKLCGEPGATIGCVSQTCKVVVHAICACKASAGGAVYSVGVGFYCTAHASVASSVEGAMLVSVSEYLRSVEAGTVGTALGRPLHVPQTLLTPALPSKTLRYGNRVVHHLGVCRRSFAANEIIIPMGYMATFIHWSVTRPGTRCLYVAEVVEGGSRGPLFRIAEAEGGFELYRSDFDEVHLAFLEALFVARQPKLAPKEKDAERGVIPEQGAGEGMMDSGDAPAASDHGEAVQRSEPQDAENMLDHMIVEDAKANLELTPAPPMDVEFACAGTKHPFREERRRRRPAHLDFFLLTNPLVIRAIEKTPEITDSLDHQFRFHTPLKREGVIGL